MQHSIILTMFTLAIFLKDNSGTDYTDYTLLHCRSGFQRRMGTDLGQKW